MADMFTSLASGVAKYAADADANSNDRKFNAAVSKYSPWTGKNAGPTTKASFAQDVIAPAAAAHAQNMQTMAKAAQAYFTGGASMAGGAGGGGGFSPGQITPVGDTSGSMGQAGNLAGNQGEQSISPWASMSKTA